MSSVGSSLGSEHWVEKGWAVGAASLLSESPIQATSDSPLVSPASDPFTVASLCPKLVFCSDPQGHLLCHPNTLFCFQDFRKYEEGFDPYSMVRENSPTLGSNPRNGGGGLYYIWC